MWSGLRILSAINKTEQGWPLYFWNTFSGIFKCTVRRYRRYPQQKCINKYSKIRLFRALKENFVAFWVQNTDKKKCSNHVVINHFFAALSMRKIAFQFQIALSFDFLINNNFKCCWNIQIWMPLEHSSTSSRFSVLPIKVTFRWSSFQVKQKMKCDVKQRQGLFSLLLPMFCLIPAVFHTSVRRNSAELLTYRLASANLHPAVFNTINRYFHY